MQGSKAKQVSAERQGNYPQNTLRKTVVGEDAAIDRKYCDQKQQGNANEDEPDVIKWHKSFELIA